MTKHKRGDVLSSLRIERHDVHRIYSIRPADPEKGIPTERTTILDRLREPGPKFMRRDIVLLNIWDPPEGHCETCQCDLEGRQAVVEVTKDGRLVGATWYLDPETLKWAEEEAARMLETAKEYPEFAKYLLV